MPQFTCQQKHRCVSQELLHEVWNDGNFLSSITTDAMLVYCYDSWTKRQSSPGAQWARQIRPNIKSMLVIFFDVRKKFLQVKQLTSITIGRVCNVSGSKSAKNTQTDGRTGSIHHNTMLAHTILSVQQFLATKNKAMVLTLHTCLIWLFLIYLFFFLRTKSQLWERCFQGVVEIQEQSLIVICVIPKSQFQWWFQ